MLWKNTDIDLPGMGFVDGLFMPGENPAYSFLVTQKEYGLVILLFRNGYRGSENSIQKMP